MKKTFLTILTLAFALSVHAKDYHICANNGSDNNPGTEKLPFKTISKAAYKALAGDNIIIHEGTYRERVSPANTGLGEYRRITYMAAEGEDVWLKGSEVVKDWKKEKNGLWSVEVCNSVFGDYNPFTINYAGDWLSQGKNLHLGSVYIDGLELSEAAKQDELESGENLWMAVVDDEKTSITANFGSANPNKALTEINVREFCFFPKTTGINYITVKGLKITQGAPQWSAPTSEQVGLIGPNWSKGWIIENCEVSHSKNVGICLGKERASGHNMWSQYKGKFGYMKCGFNREIESIFKAHDLGWSKENIGSHLVQNNEISYCGQAGIVGHMGAAFSTIRGNYIHHTNWTNGKITGAETSGIKIHAGIDIIIENNLITHSAMGLWLDWQAQGAHVRGNIFAHNEKQDMFYEVSHGPTLVYNNICLSPLNLLLRGGQGIAFFNNFFNAKIKGGSSVERYTPYHEPHSTKIKGLFNNTGGDARYYNNIFLCEDLGKVGNRGLAAINGYPVYDAKMCDSVRSTPDYLYFKFPIWTGGNVYYKGAQAYRKEVDMTQINEEVSAKLEEKDGKFFLKIEGNYTNIPEAKTKGINTEMLGITFISEAPFENPDETPFIFQHDFFGKERNVEKPVAGPFEMGYKGEVIFELAK